jgi:hypothetical protein
MSLHLFSFSVFFRYCLIRESSLAQTCADEMDIDIYFEAKGNLSFLISSLKVIFLIRRSPKMKIILSDFIEIIFKLFLIL